MQRGEFSHKQGPEDVGNLVEVGVLMTFDGATIDSNITSTHLKKTPLIAVNGKGQKVAFEEFMNGEVYKTYTIQTSSTSKDMSEDDIRNEILKRMGLGPLEKMKERSELHRACESDDKGELEKLIGSGISIKETEFEKSGQTPLLVAARHGYLEIVKTLVEHGAKVDDAHDYGFTPLFAACLYGHVAVVKYLLEQGADVNLTKKFGTTPLAAACRNESMEVIEALLAKGPNVDQVGQKGSGKDGTCRARSPLWISCALGNLKVAQKLIKEYGAKVDAPDFVGLTPFAIACANLHLEVAEFLLKHKEVTVNSTTNAGKTPLWTASCNGRISVVKFLLKHGADYELPDTEGITPLGIATENGHKDVTLELVTAGAPILIRDNFGRTPLWMASSRGYDNIVEILMDKAKQANIEHCDILDINGIATEVKTKYLEIRDVNGLTPLAAAVESGRADTVKLLVNKFGARRNTTTKAGKTLLWIASCHGFIKIVEILLDKEANIDEVDSDGATSLAVAALNGHAEVVEKLISYGAAVNTKDKKGRTPLWNASSGGHADIVKLLIPRVDRLDERDFEGATPLDIAGENGHSEIQDMLLHTAKKAAADCTSEETE
ncbi:hypothetical protein HDU97_008571 [Phlyctochytrium planicorne]|nr:hypothetical protein HDU97_008571 [Phlyctochytrium planicorne]